MKRVTIDTVMGWHPCSGYDRERVKGLFGRRKYLKASQILDLDIPGQDRLWAVLREDFFTEQELRLLACDFAERVLPIYEAGYPDDNRPRRCIEVSRRHAVGEATAEDLAEARAAASAAGAASAAWEARAAWAAGAAGATGAARAAWAARAAELQAQIDIVKSRLS